jgi:hypothetical protein
MLSLPTLTLPVLTPFYSARTFFVQGVPLSELHIDRVCAVAATGADALVGYAHVARAHAPLFLRAHFLSRGCPCLTYASSVCCCSDRR